jgi:hypothetical protein
LGEGIFPNQIGTEGFRQFHGVQTALLARVKRGAYQAKVVIVAGLRQKESLFPALNQ